MSRHERRGRVAVVTGTSRGIGRAIAKELAERGLDVLATSRDAAAGKKAADELGLPFHALDVTSDASVEALRAHLAETRGGLDVLVDNAGVALDGFDASVARRTIDVNFRGTVRVTDALLPMIREGGRIVMVSSGMGELACLAKDVREELASPTLSRSELMAIVDRFVDGVAKGTHQAAGFPSNAYRVSKVAMNAYVRVLSRELASDPRGIKVNAGCPGWVRTRMGGAGAPRSPEEGAKTPVWLALLPSDGPMGGFFRDERAVPW